MIRISKRIFATGLFFSVTLLLSSCNFGFMSVGSTSAPTTESHSLANSLVATRLVVTGPSRLNLKNCVGPFTVTSRSAKNVESGMSVPTAVGLNSTKNATFFSDSNCSTTINSLSFNKATSKMTFYMKGNVADSAVLSATASNFESISAQITVVRVVDHLAISAPSAVTLGVCSPSQATVVTKDIENNTFASNTSIGVTITGLDNIYSDPNCQISLAMLNTVNLAPGTNSFSFYFKTTATPPAPPALPPPISMAAVSAGIITGTASVAVNHLATKLKFSALPVNTNVGVCSGAIEVNSQDGINVNFPISTTAETEVEFTATNTPGTPTNLSQYFYRDDQCLGAPSSRATITRNTTSAKIYFKVGAVVTGAVISAQTVGATPLNGTTTPTLSIQHLVTQLRFTLPLPTGTNVGVCSGQIRINALDGLNSPFRISTSAATNVTFTAIDDSNASNDLSQYFYDGSDTNCTGTPTRTVSIPANGTFTTVRYKVGTVVAGVKLSAASTSPALSSDPTPPVLSIAHTVTHLEFTTLPTGNHVGVCTGAIEVSARDGLNHDLAITPASGPTASNTPVTFTATNGVSNLPNTNFFTVAGCGTGTSGNVASIPAGQVKATIFFKSSSQISTAVLSATTSSPSLSADPTGTINFDDIPTKLKFGALPSVNAGVCSPPIPVDALDPLNNAVPFAGSSATPVTFTATDSLASPPNNSLNSYFYSDANCGTQTSTVNFAAGASRANIFMKIGVASGPANLGASTGAPTSLSSDSPVLNVRQDGATLAFSALPTATFGQCSSSFQVRTLDVTGAVRPVAQSTSVTIGVGSGTLFSDSDCLTTASTTFNLTAASSSATFFYKAIDSTDVSSATASVTATSPSSPQRFVNNATAGSISITRQRLVLDNNYNSSGKILHAISGNGEGLSAAYQSSTNKVVVVGYQTVSGVPQLLMARFDGLGNLDTTFGTNGIVSFAVGNQSKLSAVVLDASNIYAAGVTNTGTPANNNFLLVKTDVDGKSPSSFNFDMGNGISTNQDDEATAIVISGTKVVLAGSHVEVDDATATPPLTHSQFAVAVLNASNPNSSPVLTTKTSLNAFAKAVALDSSNRILVAGSMLNGSNQEMAMFRFTAAGLVDATFNSPSNDLKLIGVTGPSEARDILVQSTGAIVLSGSSAGQMALARVTVSGGTLSLDTSFNGSGIVTSSALTSGLSVVQDITSNKNLIVVGESSSNMVVRRYSKDGAFDAGNTNSVSIPFTSSGSPVSSIANACVVQSDGDIVAVGTANNQLGLARVLP